MLRRVAPLAAAALAAFVFACGTDAVGVDTCKQIEEARCRQAPSCGISLAEPPHRDPDVEACIRFYDVACLHGLEISGDPTASIVKACVKAINTSCDAVVAPESAPACAWLIPPATPDAGIDASPDVGLGTDAGDGGD